jgi:predicted Zn-dependent peptidase
MSVEVSVLDNGLTIASDSMDEVETVSLGVWVGVGTRHEPGAVNGVAHLLEHMAFKGTKRRSAEDIAEEIEAVGGQVNAYTGREATAYYVKLLAGDLPLAVDILADILQHSVFDETELARERAVVLQEIGQAQDTPDDIVFDHYQETAYPDQPLGRPVLGRPEVVRRLDRGALLDYLGDYYAGERMVLAAAGRLDHERLVALAGEAFAELPARSRAATTPATYHGGDFRETRDLEQVHLVFGFDAVGFRHPDYYTAAVFSTLLGGGMSSRLFQEVREKRGLVYSIFSFLGAHSDSGLFGVYAGTGEAECRELLPVIRGEFEKVAEQGAKPKDVARAKAQIKASILMGRERTGNRAEHLANQILIHGRPLELAEILGKVEAVDEAAVAAFAGRLIAGTPTLAALGPLSGLTGYDRPAGAL